MTEDAMTAGKFYVTVLLKSKGVEALNRLHGRDFSVNILSMNAKELLDAIAVVENPQIMVEAFAEKNRGASAQIHREINRLAHNYLCSVSTLVDHNRNFMLEHYEGSAFQHDYDREIQRRFNLNERARFVKDFRNYVTHRGLPNSSIGLHFTALREEAEARPDGAGVPASIRSGVTVSVKTLLQWNGWTSPAKRFLENIQTDDVSLRDIFEQHIQMMKDFNDWFEQRFQAHHEVDLKQLDDLQAQYRRLEQVEEAV
jgi:hypothetical protein